MKRCWKNVNVSIQELKIFYSQIVPLEFIFSTDFSHSWKCFQFGFPRLSYYNDDLHVLMDRTLGKRLVSKVRVRTCEWPVNGRKTSLQLSKNWLLVVCFKQFVNCSVQWYTRGFLSLYKVCFYQTRSFYKKLLKEITHISQGFGVPD